MAEGVETRVTMTTRIRQFLQDIYKDNNLGRTLKSKIRIALTPSESEEVISIAYDVLDEAHQFYSDFKRPKKESDFIELRDLLKEAKVYNYNIPEPERSPELVERLNRLRKEQDQREYDKMVKNVDKKKKKTLGEELGGELRTTKQQVSSIVNFLLSIAATFAFGFYSSQYAFSDDLGVRIILSITLATVVAIAELYFMSRYEI